MRDLTWAEGENTPRQRNVRYTGQGQKRMWTVNASGTQLGIQMSRGEKPRRWRKSQKIFDFCFTVVELV